MSGFIDFLISINKIALFAFFAVLLFLIYEIKKMSDEKKAKSKPIVPQFNDTVQVQPASQINSTPLPSQLVNTTSSAPRTPFLMIFIGIGSLIALSALAVISYNTYTKKKNTAIPTVPIIREIQSDGLKIYDAKWNEIDTAKNGQVVPGEKLFIGIKTIDEVDIDRARIKINANDWQVADITTLFKSELRVYYKEYTVATGTAQLKIEAQLHSASDGWMGE